MADRPEVSPTCEVITNWKAEDIGYCGKPTTVWYPCEDGNTMALCEEHSLPHVPYVRPYITRLPDSHLAEGL